MGGSYPLVIVLVNENLLRMRIVFLILLASFGHIASSSNCGITEDQLKKLNADMAYISDLVEDLKSTYGNTKSQKRSANEQETEFMINAETKERRKRQIKQETSAVESLSIEDRLAAVEDATQNLLFQFNKQQEREDGVQIALQQYEEMVRKFVEARMDSFQATIVQAFMTSAVDVERKLTSLAEKTDENKQEIHKLQQQQSTTLQNCTQQSSCANQDLLETIENRIVVATARYDDRLESARNAFKTEISSVVNVQSFLRQKVAIVSQNMTELSHLIHITSERDEEISNILNKLTREIDVVATKTMAHVFSALNGFDKDHKMQLHSINNTLMQMKEEMSLNNDILYQGLAATNVTINSIKAYLTESDLQGSQSEQLDTTFIQEVIDRLENQQPQSTISSQNSVESQYAGYETVSELMLEQSEKIESVRHALQEVVSKTDSLENEYIELKEGLLELQRETEQLEPLHQLLQLKYLQPEGRSLTNHTEQAHNRCHAIGHLSTIPGTDVWCTNNCDMGFCPTSFCECSVITARKAERIICRATAAFGMIRNANEWCETNCAAGHCPPRQCTCAPEQRTDMTPQKVCRATDSFSVIPNANHWCAENCASGHCPPSSCICE